MDSNIKCLHEQYDRVHLDDKTENLQNRDMLIFIRLGGEKKAKYDFIHFMSEAPLFQ